MHCSPQKSASIYATRNASAMVLGCTVAGLLACNPESALATCGDYLYRNGKPVSDHSISEHPGSLTQESPASKSRGRRSPLAPLGGCSGPHCSNQPIPLDPTPAVPISQLRSLDAAALLLSHGLGCGSRGTIQPPDSERGAFYLPSEVYRPPAN